MQPVIPDQGGLSLETQRVLRLIGEQPPARFTRIETVGRFLVAMSARFGATLLRSAENRLCCSDVIILSASLQAMFDNLPPLPVPELSKLPRGGGVHGASETVWAACPQRPSVEKITGTLIPFHVSGDGNCLWRSFSVSLFGTDAYWRAIKCRTLLYMMLHREQLAGHAALANIMNFLAAIAPADFVNSGLSDVQLARHLVLYEAVKMCAENVYAGVVEIVAVSCMLRLPILVVYPSFRGAEIAANMASMLITDQCCHLLPQLNPAHLTGRWIGLLFTIMDEKSALAVAHGTAQFRESHFNPLLPVNSVG